MTWYIPLEDGQPAPHLGAFSAPPPGVNCVVMTDAELTAARQESEQPHPNWDGFNVWMLQETAFKELCSMAFQRGHGSMVSALFSAYRDVATGKTEPFEITFAAVCAAGGALQEDRERWATQAAKMHLPETFCQIIKGNNE